LGDTVGATAPKPALLAEPVAEAIGGALEAGAGPPMAGVGADSTLGGGLSCCSERGTRTAAAPVAGLVAGRPTVAGTL
jgi:hypothetical protein